MKITKDQKKKLILEFKRNKYSMKEVYIYLLKKKTNRFKKILK